MTDLNRTDSSNLDGFILTAGTPVLAARYGNGGAPTLTQQGCTLVLSTTYVFPFGAPRSAVPAESPLVAAFVRWDAAAILTITVETAIVPAAWLGADPRAGTPQLTDFDATAGFWLPQNPPTAYVPVVGGTVGTGATAMTVSVAGGAAGGCEFDLGNFGARRGRVKIVVGATGGVVRVGVHGKAAA